MRRLILAILAVLALLVLIGCKDRERVFVPVDNGSEDDTGERKDPQPLITLVVVQFIPPPNVVIQSGFPVLLLELRGELFGLQMFDNNGDGVFAAFFGIEFPSVSSVNVELASNLFFVGKKGETISSTGGTLIANGVTLEQMVAGGPSGAMMRLELDSDGDVVIPVRSIDTFQYKQWYHSATNVAAAWQTTTGNRDLVVAVLDTGIQLDHPDLKNNIFVNKSEVPGNGVDDDNNGFVDDVHGFDFIDFDGDPSPDTFNVFEFFPELASHGTICAGIIGAARDNFQGIAGIAQCRLMSVRVFNSFGGTTVETLAAGIDYAAANGANIMILSFAGPFDFPEIREAVKRANQRGIVLVAACGNDLTDVSFFPAAYPEVIGVSALDRQSRLSFFSNFGELNSEICAPGEDVFSTVIGNDTKEFPNLFQGGRRIRGTSFAAPQVVGAAALLRSVRPDLRPEDVATLLVQNGDNIDRSNSFFRPQDIGPRLNVGRAMAVAPGFRPSAFVQPPRPPPTAAETLDYKNHGFRLQ